MTKELLCPKCKYPQFCPCDSCKDRLPEGFRPWIDVGGNKIKCAKCGFTMHADGWLYEEWKQLRRGNNV